MSTTTINESSCWMTAVGIPLEDVLYVQRMAPFAAHGVDTVRARVTEILDAAYDALVACSMLPGQLSVSA